MIDLADPERLVARVRRLEARLGPDRRLVIGIAGKPGAGKSTVAAGLVERLGSTAVVVPMDGFHLADAVLAQLGLADRKGVPETFDPDGFAAVLARLRHERGPVFVPGFHRDLEQPIAQSIMITPAHRILIAEGNYLLLDAPGWSSVRSHLDEVWWLASDESVRLTRLRQRHVRFGKSAEAADAWMAAVDGPNAELVAPTAAWADLTIPALP